MTKDAGGQASKYHYPLPWNPMRSSGESGELLRIRIIIMIAITIIVIVIKHYVVEHLITNDT